MTLVTGVLESGMRAHWGPYTVLVTSVTKIGRQNKTYHIGTADPEFLEDGMSGHLPCGEAEDGCPEC